MIHTRLPRIGIVGMGHYKYWPQFDGLLDELKQKHLRFRQYFSDNSELFDLGYADSIDTSLAALKKALPLDLDALFIIMSTYVTSCVAFPFARYLKIPQILVALQPSERLDYKNTTTYTQLANDDICSLPEFAGVYGRLSAAEPFIIVETEKNTDEIRRRIGQFERAISACAAFKYAKFGYLGHTYDGMYDMNTDPTAFAGAFGAHVTMLEMCELAEHFESVTDGEIRNKKEEILSIFDIMDPSVDPLTDAVRDEDVIFSARCAAALDRLVEANGLTALAYYYNGTPGGKYERIASNLIIGNTLLTSKGIPLAGEADLKTAAAMLAMNRFGGGGSFAELHPFDSHDDIILIGHDGPHNITVSEGRPVIRKLRKYHGKPGAGLSVEFRLRNGDITLLSCSSDSKGGFRMISTKCRSIPGDIPQTGNTNTRCRFDMKAERFVEKWSAAGPTHHMAIGVGDHTAEAGLFCAMMGITNIQIGKD